MTAYEISGLLITHLIADFVLQDKDWAMHKWRDNSVLLTHVSLYTLCFTLYFTFVDGSLVYGDIYTFLGVCKFLTITFVTHFIIDYITSKITHYQAENKIWGGHIPNLGFFTTIGIDQTLHYLQLIHTYDIFLINPI